jgi:hypothetical protein
MKKNFFPFILFSISGFAQEFTPPDSAAIIKAHVKSVKIYFDGNGSKHFFMHEFRYNEKGQCVYENSGSSYYYAKEYDEKGMCVRQVQRGMDGNFISGWETDYYPSKKQFHVKAFYNGDTIHPASIMTYNEKGDPLSQIYFYKGEMKTARYFTYNSQGICTSIKDSVPFDRVTIHDPKNLRQVKLYDSLGHYKEKWKFEYDSTGKLVSSEIQPGTKMYNIYTFTYDANGKVSRIEYNHHPISDSKKNDWEKQWGYLLPKDETEDFQLPYSDPVAIPNYAHTLKRDKQGNILTDEVASTYTYSWSVPVLFTYEYTYWR